MCPAAIFGISLQACTELLLCRKQLWRVPPLKESYIWVPLKMSTTRSRRVARISEWTAKVNKTSYSTLIFYIHAHIQSNLPMSVTSIKQSPVLKGQNLLCLNGDLLIKVWLYIKQLENSQLQKCILHISKLIFCETYDIKVF